VEDAKTVSNQPVVLDDSPIVKQQKLQVNKMRDAILSVSEESGMTLRHVINGITAMRIYHYVTRIIEYTAIMDELDSKINESMRVQIRTSDVTDPGALLLLLTYQERLQKSMIESQKLLEPYLKSDFLDVLEMAPPATVDNTFGAIMGRVDRENLRTVAQSVLAELGDSSGG